MNINKVFSNIDDPENSKIGYEFVCSIGKYFRINSEEDFNPVIEDCTYCKFANQDKLKTILDNPNSRKITLENIKDICCVSDFRVSMFDLDDSIKRYFNLLGIGSHMGKNCEKLKKNSIFLWDFQRYFVESHKHENLIS